MRVEQIDRMIRVSGIDLYVDWGPPSSINEFYFELVRGSCAVHVCVCVCVCVCVYVCVCVCV
jgi:hypothetical protein